MQTHRSLVDRLQILSSTLTSQLTDSNERDRIRRRLNELTRRWTELEQELISEEEDVTEITNITQQFTDINSKCERWIKQTKDLINELTHTKTIEIFDQLIPKAKTTLSEYQSAFEHLQRLRNRLSRFAQTNKTPEATHKVNLAMLMIFCVRKQRWNRSRYHSKYARPDQASRNKMSLHILYQTIGAGK
jgi:DNA repair exonuclease SbcCD ATPase subunit